MLAWGLAASVVSSPSSRADEPGTREGASATFGVGTARVLLDVVVRDRKGALVRGLGASDFEVREDGARQAVDSFRAVERGVATLPQEGVAQGAGLRAEDGRELSTPGASAGAGSVLVFVFDAMTPAGRDWAHQAALSYLDGDNARSEQAAVFAIEGGLRVVEPFTRDPNRLRAAFDRALQQGIASSPIDDRAETRLLVDDIDRAQVGLPRAGAGTNLKEAIGATAARSAVEQMQVRMTRTFERLERDEGGQASMNALLAVVNAIGGIPGRKALILFSEGLLVPAGARAQFRSVVASANRANVSIYSLDAGGLRAESGTAETRREIDAAAIRRMRQFNEGGGDAPDGDMMRLLERNEDLLRLNPESGLGELAEATGGFLAQGTNDARGAFGRLVEDLGSYYLLSYTPSNDSYDGKFRTIEVKLRRPGLRIQARRGYFAVRPSSAPTLADEAPAVAALDRRPKRNAFPLGMAALTFPEPQRPGLVPIVVDTPLAAISCAPAAASGDAPRCAVDFEVVVRIDDDHRREVDRMSRRYRFTSPTVNPPSTRPGSVLFYREADLPPGRYTVEAAGYDAIARTASVETADLTVPEVVEDRLRLSSVVLVTHADPLDAGEAKAASVLRFGDVVLYPSTGRAWSRSKSPTLAFFFVVYGAGAAKPQALVEVRRGDQSVQTTRVDLPDPDATGRIAYAGALPLASLGGAYTLRVTVADARGSDARVAPFTVIP